MAASARFPYDGNMPARQEVLNPETPIHRVYLTGFMGAGKSTVGPLLASLLNWRFYDLDSLIESQAGHSVAALFDQHGEVHFRRLELETLRTMLAAREAVISLGGGAVETAELRSLLAQDTSGRLVFLEAPLHQLIGRCAAQDGGASRPLMRNLPVLQSRYERRLAHYREAHLTVATQDLGPHQVADAIMQHLATHRKHL